MSMTKRILSLLLALILLLSNVPAVVFATEDMTEPVVETETVATEEVTVPAETELPTQPETVPEETVAPTQEKESADMIISDEAMLASGQVASGTCGSNLKWTLDDKNTLTISGSGSTYGYRESNLRDYCAPWFDYRTSIETIVIESGVTNLGAYVFYRCTAVTKVTIPDSVTNISQGAFRDCWSLTDITIPNSVTNMDSYAFEGCSNLVSIALSENLTAIADYAFRDCISLTEITIPNGVTSIGYEAFNKCASLCSITLSDSITSIDRYAFSNCGGLAEVHISNLENWCKINFNDNRANPLYAAEELYLNGSLVTDIVIPNGVELINTYAFYGYKRLNSVTIPNSVISIGDGAFSGCSGLTSINLPDSITHIGDSTFSSCSGLTSINLPDSITRIGDSTFSGCRSLASIRLPDSLTSIGNWTFSRCSSLAGISLPDSLTDIGDESFSGCSSLTSVSLPDNLTSIGNSTFYDCSGLTSVSLPDSLTSIGNSTFYGCSNLTSVSLPDSLTGIGYSTFYGCSNLTSINLPDSLTHIGAEFFSGCSSLTSVSLPDSLASVGDRVFYGCSSLNSISLPNSFTDIGEYVFLGCGNLTVIEFEGNAPYIASKAFFGVTATAYYPEGDATWTSDILQNYGGTITWICGTGSGGDNPDTGETEPEEPTEALEYHNTLEELTKVDYLAFAQVAYEDFVFGETVRQCLERKSGNRWDDVWGEDEITYAELCEGIAQWKVCYIKENSANGFYAVAFRNDSGEAVLAYRGSKPLTNALEMIADEQSYKDWVANDLAMILFNEVTDENQYNSAICAYKHTKNVDGIHTIVTTGHSLGGLWGDVASAYSGCQGITFNAISALDTMYVNHPIALGRGFQGIDAWNFMDQINVYDILAGAMEAASSDLGLSIKLKPFMAYSSNYSADSVINSHSLKSLISRSGDKLVLNQTVGSWVGTSGTSGHLASTSRSIDMGISGSDYFDKGLKLNDRRSAFGGNGTDYIYTSIRDDTLVGGRGNDRLDGSWGDDTYYYFKGDGTDTIIDIGGHDKLCLKGFEDSDLIEMYEDKDSDYISIRYDGSTIVDIYKKNRDYSVVTSSSFRVYVNDGQENNITEYFSKYKSGSRLLVQCPVSVEILDVDGNVVYILQDGAVGSYYTDYGNFYVFEEEDGGYGKVLDLAAGYTARVVGEDTGSMKIEYRSVVNGELCDEAKNFADVPVSVEFTATFEETADGELVLAADTDADGTVDTKLGYDGKPVPVESLELAQEYIALKPGEVFKLHADVKPAELTQFLCWDEEDSENLLHVEQDGTVIGQNVGTAYVLVTVKNGDTSITERCRVDVAQTEPTTEPSAPDEQPVEKIVVEGIQLSTDKVTTELYKNEFATFEILLDLPQNHPVAEGEMVISNAATMGQAGMSNVIESVELAANSDLFQLIVLDDRTVQVVPTQKALDEGKTLKSSYKDSVIVKLRDQSVPETEKLPLTINVKKTLPKLKATVAAFNSFYDGQTMPIVVTGGTATSIYENESKNTAKTTAIPTWLTLNEDETLTLKPDAPLKSVSGSAYVMVETAEWRIPAAVTISAKNTYKAPGLKLSATTVTASTRPDSGGIALKLLCTNKNDTLSSLNVSGITAPKGYKVDFKQEDGSFILKADEAFKAEKITLQVDFDDAVTTNKLNLDLTIRTAAVTLKLASTSVKLNQAVSDNAKVKVTVTPADYRPEKLDWQLTTVENKVTVDKTESGELDVRYENGEIHIHTTPLTPEKQTYKLSVSAGGSKPVTATINVTTAEPTVTLKATGAMDLSFPNQTANIAATFTNYNGTVKSYSYSVAELKGKTVIDENVKAKFHVDQEGKTFKIRCVDESVNLANTYAVTLKLTLEDGRTLDKTVNLKVKRTIVKLKLSSTKLSLNKLIGDEGSITVTSATKGYAFEGPVWTLTDSKNADAAGELNIRYEGDKLYVGTKDETVYGKTYKITLKADDYGTASVLTVTVPAKEKSTPTVTIKAAGKVDVIRDGSAVTITPTYKNCITTTSAEETITIYNSKKEDVTDQFEINPNGNGGYTVTKAEKGKLPAGTYKVKLVAMFGQTKAESKEISMSVVMGSVKLTAKTSGTTMFAKDRNDRALIWFETTDASLNEVSSITFKNATQAKMFEIIPYGDGLFAIGFKDGTVDKSLIAAGKATGKTVTVSLNVFVDGNATTDPAISKTAKTNTTVNVKLTIAK